MKNMKLMTVLTLVAAFFLAGPLDINAYAGEEPDKLMVVWSSGDKEVAQMVALTYPMVAKKNKMFAEVSILVWGASTKLLSKDAELQALLKKLKGMGIEILVCKWCADQYGVADKLTEMGLKVDYMGKTLTNSLKSDEWSVLTF